MVATIEVVVHALNVRDGAGVGYNASSALFQGDHATVDNYAPGMLWLHIIAPHVGYIDTVGNQGQATIQLLDIAVPDPAPSGDTELVRTTDTVHVRSGPGTSNPIVTTLEPNVTIMVYAHIAQKDDGYTWYQLATTDQRWIAAMYTVPVTGTVPPPQPVPAPPQLPWSLPFPASWRGVGTNTGGWVPGPNELALIKKNDVKVALMVAYNTNVAGQAIPRLRDAGIQGFVVRASTYEPISTAQRFLDLTMPALHEYFTALGNPQNMLIAVHNEPNLYSEGLSHGWQDGAGFAAFFATVAQTYRATLPGCKLGFPATSPGPAVAGIRMNERMFTQQAIAAIRASDWIGLHAYWAKQDASDFAPEMTYWQQFGKPVIATEVGPVSVAVVNSQTVLNAYKILGNAGISCCAWVLNGTGQYQNADWCFNGLTL